MRLTPNVCLLDCEHLTDAYTCVGEEETKTFLSNILLTQVLLEMWKLKESWG